MSEVDFRVRTADAADLNTLVGLLTELFVLESDFTPAPERQRQGLSQLLRSPEARILAAEYQGEVVGMCTLQIVISTAEGGASAWLEDMIVARAWRGRGIGRALLRAAENWAAERGCRRLQLVAELDNVPALGFYAAGGWQQTNLICLRRSR